MRRANSGDGRLQVKDETGAGYVPAPAPAAWARVDPALTWSLFLAALDVASYPHEIYELTRLFWDRPRLSYPHQRRLCVRVEKRLDQMRATVAEIQRALQTRI